MDVIASLGVPYMQHSILLLHFVKSLISLHQFSVGQHLMGLFDDPGIMPILFFIFLEVLIVKG
tara:strand:- start:142 stop:330 length:189 start_codon:yes stop_codon:yes gene_type:complete